MRAVELSILIAAVKGLSLASLCLANVWYHTLDGTPARYYALHGPASPARLCASLANLGSLGAVFALVLLARNVSLFWASVAGLCLAAVLCLQALSLYRTAHDHSRPLRRAVRSMMSTARRRAIARLTFALALTISGVWAARHPVLPLFWKAVDVLAWGAVPLLLWAVARTLRFLLRGHPAHRGSADRASHSGVRTPPSLTATFGSAGTARPRVVWVVFDELDFGVAFARRPSTIALPHFDRLVQRSISCTEALPPAHCTELAMPALVSGLRVAGTWPVSRSDLLVALRGPGQGTLVAEDARLRRVRWSEQETVFSRARQLGARSAMVGWYHPYERVIGAHLDWCAWHEAREPAFAVRPSFWGAYVDQFRGLLETASYSPFGQSLTVRKAVQQHAEIRRQALDLVAHPAYDIVFVHWPIPHAPYFYDTSRGRTTRANRGLSGYLDNLVLTDDMLGEVLNALASTERGRASTLIVSSDHWWRNAVRYDGVVDHRVPFIVRLPGGTAPLPWDRPFETVRTSDLIVSILEDAIHDADALLRWLDAEGVERDTSAVAI